MSDHDDVMERAKGAHCIRCKEQIVGSPSMSGTTMFQVYVPALSVRRRGILCGACGLLLREFLQPELLDDQIFQVAKVELQSRWG